MGDIKICAFHWHGDVYEVWLRYGALNSCYTIEGPDGVSLVWRGDKLADKDWQRLLNIHHEARQSGCLEGENNKMAQMRRVLGIKDK